MRVRFRKWIGPLVFFQIYLLGVLVLFLYGPWPWVLDNRPQFVGYLAAVHGAICVGYLLAWPVLRSVATPLRTSEKKQRNALIVALIVSSLMTIPTSLARTGNLFPDVISGFSDSGAAYSDGLAKLADGNGFLAVEYARFITTAFQIALLPLLVVCWKFVGWGLRIWALAVLMFFVAIYVAGGQNKGLADMVVLTPFFVCLALPENYRIRAKPVALAGGICIVACLFFLSFFGNTQAQRDNGATKSIYPFGGLVLLAQQDHWLSSHLPDRPRIIFESVTRYLGQGYQAVALTLNLDHPSTLGAGNSMFLARNADRLFNTNFFETQSLPAILEAETGWPMYGLWHSILPWIASDVGYGGALIVMAALSFLLAFSWARSAQTSDPLWITILSMLLTLFFYIPANNQIFQSGETTVAFLLVLTSLGIRSMWRLFRSKTQPVRV